MQDKRFLGLMDMIDGGGMGRAGSEFEGGPLSGLLNALGIRPQGYAARMEEQEAMPALLPRPTPAASPMQDRSTEELVAMIEAALGRSGYADMQKSVYAPGAVTTTPLMEKQSPNRFAPSYFGMGPR
jgi:hypothetical protein